MEVLPMKRFCVGLGLTVMMSLSINACGPRQASVRTAPTSAEATIHFTNNLDQPVNVYVVQGGNETFVRQVGANTTENLPVRGIALGSQVLLRAVTVDGKKQFDTQNPVALTSTYTWRVP
jgi:queuine/archaeosine tRNA-ribosyltransferase